MPPIRTLTAVAKVCEPLVDAATKLREAPTLLLSYGLRRSEAAALAMAASSCGWPVVHRARGTAAATGGVSRAAYRSHVGSASRSEGHRFEDRNQ